MNDPAHVILYALAALLGTALSAPWLHRVMGERALVALAVVPAAIFVAFCGLIGPVAAQGAVHVAMPWADALGIRLAFFIDGLSLFFLLIISVIGVFIVLFSTGYLHGKRELGKFLMVLLGFMGAMLGIVASDNLFLLFVFWELTSITSFLLIAFYHEEADSRRSALQALLVTGAGGLAMLAGFILLAQAAGTADISQLLALPPGTISAHPLFPAIFVLILLGAFTKSAQFPFHFWLPNAMAGPAPVSAFLHSATMVKAGVFLLARLHPCLADHPWWTPVVAPVGAVTMMLGVFLGAGQTDLKKILAYTTLSVLGTLTLLLGLGTQLAIQAMVVYLLAHALYKAALFMAAGTVDHETGTREIGALGGLGRGMPRTAAGAGLAALSMAGLPIFLGFVSKEYFYKALLAADGPPYLWEILGVLASVVLLALAVVVGVLPFLGTRKDTPKAPHDPPWTMWLGPLVLGALAIKFGLFPGWVGDHLVEPAVRAVAGDPALAVHLKLWHGWNTALMLSLVTVAGGAAMVVYAPVWRQRTRALYAWLTRCGADPAYDRALAGLLGFAAWQTRLLQNGRLRSYVLAVGAFTTLLLGLALARAMPGLGMPALQPPTLIGTTICLLISAAAVAACFARSRFAAILTLGVVGLGVAILFFLYGAPDVAMTQILVETLSVVLFVLAFYRLPMLKDFSPGPVRLRDAVVSLTFGGVMATLVLVAMAFPATTEPIARFFGETSLPQANGRNVVNVILVDFRALDTLGEITVLAIAALGVYAMIRLKPPQP
jgi:multicomponent Na+:H+ antiporter subunit A